MAQAKHTYAIRLSVDGGGKVKAELMDVGRAGDKSLKKIETAGSKASLGLTKLSDRAQSLGRNMKLLYGAIAAGGAIRGLQEMVKLYADFEAGLIGVGKTANLSKTDLASLGKDIDALSKQIPVATDELLAIAQSAGQLGVKGADNILKFTETVAKLGTATDLSGNDAAMALARILNVTGEAMGTVDVLGSVIVALGNNFAATESQITEMTTEIARATAVFGVSSADASALAAALASVGVQSEVAGTSVGRVMHMMDAAVRSGGKHLDILSKITRTEETLDKSLEDDKEGNPFLKGVPAIVEALQSGQIECRVYNKDKFHAKAYITHAKTEVLGAQALVGSSNFTRPGLTQNIELNIQVKSGTEVAQLQEWFEHHWKDGKEVTEDIVKLISRHTHAYSPFDIYAKALQELFRGHEITASEWEEARSKMFPSLDQYQKEAYWALLKIARQHGGAFLCDGVGLGKTFVGLMLIERLVLHDGKRVVLFAPKGAKEGVWEPHLRDWLSHIGGVGGGAPYHPQTQGKIERWHQTLKNRILLENYFFPADLEAQIEAFVDQYNHHRYHESINNLTPADVYFGRGQSILKQRERIKRKTMENRRLQHRKVAA